MTKLAPYSAIRVLTVYVYSLTPDRTLELLRHLPVRYNLVPSYYAQHFYCLSIAELVLRSSVTQPLIYLFLIISPSGVPLPSGCELSFSGNRLARSSS